MQRHCKPPRSVTLAEVRKMLGSMSINHERLPGHVQPWHQIDYITVFL